MKNSTFTMLVVGGCLAACLAFFGGLGLWIVLRPSRLADVAREEIRELPDISAESPLMIPVSIPLELIERLANDAVPETMIWADGAVTRGQIGVTSADGVLHVAAPIRGRGGQGLVRGEADGFVSLGLRPRFTERWDIALNPQVQVTVSEVRPVLFDFPSVRESVRRQAQDVVEERVRELEPTASGALASLAERAWSSPCREFPVFPDSDMRVEARLSAVSITQPVVEGSGVRLGLGLHGSVRIPADTAGVRCPSAQLNVREAEGGSGGLAVDVGYGTVNDALANELVGKTFAGDGVAVFVDAVNVGPYYDGSLLVDARVFVGNAGLLPENRPIRILLVVAPRVDVATQSIQLSVEELDTESRNPLVAIAGELGESRMREAFESQMRAALGPLAGSATGAGESPLDAMVREVADDVLDDAMGAWDNAYVRVNAAFDSIRLVGLEVGRARMRVVVRPYGSVALLGR